MKRELGQLEAVPSKRLFQSIIADYDLNRSVCELMDNVLDIWQIQGKSSQLSVDIGLDTTQQIIRFEDNAGGVAEDDLSLLVAPGLTKIDEKMETIGYFGVGTKRAIVALSQDAKIKTRPRRGKTTYLIEVEESWLKNDAWDLPYYETDSISEGHTILELKSLRKALNPEMIEHLKEHLSTTYAEFLDDKRLSVKVNGVQLRPIDLENWAYPPGFEPVRQRGTLETTRVDKVEVQVTAGLSQSSSTVEYGVYLYCNGRLVARALKDISVGYARGQAGLPHQDLSLARIFVHLNGPAIGMPWNSSKSGINTSHPVFLELQSFLIENVKYWTSLSRRTSREWPDKVFAYSAGAIRHEVVSFPVANMDYYAELPRSKHSRGEHLKEANKNVISNKPWAKGHLSSIIAVDLISRKDIEEKNRICLIILDSTLEIAFKDYLVNESGQYYSDKQLLSISSQRHLVVNEVKKYVTISNTDWKKMAHYHDRRCKLIHERASAGISDDDLKDFRSVTEKVLKKLFNLRFKTD